MSTKPTDLRGMRFGRWLVIDYSNRTSSDGYPYWKCKCDCGTVRDVHERSLVRGRSISCGCSRKGVFKPKVSRSDKDALMIGKRFGRWTVIARADDYVIKTGERYDQWRCVCDCGTKRVVLGANLTSGKSASCGCLKDELAKTRNIGNRVEPKYTTLSIPLSIKDMLRVVNGNDVEINEQTLKSAVEEMFPYYWQKKVRDEQTTIRRYGNVENIICNKCGKQAKLDMHHVIPVSSYGGNEPNNIMWLCNDCHKEIERERMQK